MTVNRAFFNPFRMLGLRRINEETELNGLHAMNVSDSSSLEEALLIVMSKIIETTRLLSKCVLNCTPSRVHQCSALIEEVHDQEKVLTTDLISSDVRGSMLKGLLAFPHRLARIGDLLEVILECCRAKSQNNVQFNETTETELDQVFLLLLDMMTNTRDAFNMPDDTLLKSIISESRRLTALSEDFRLSYWRRSDKTADMADRSTPYLDILNAVGGVAEHLEKMCQALLELKRLAGASDEENRTSRNGFHPTSFGLTTEEDSFVRTR